MFPIFRRQGASSIVVGAMVALFRSLRFSQNVIRGWTLRAASRPGVGLGELLSYRSTSESPQHSSKSSKVARAGGVHDIVHTRKMSKKINHA